MIEFVKNSHSQIIPLYNSRFLCSFQRPLSEAEKWFESFDLRKNNEICVIGGGAGYHIQYLNLRYPNKKIRVFEIIPEIVDHLENKFKSYKNITIKQITFGDSKKTEFYESLMKSLLQWVSVKMPIVLVFRPSWQWNENTYEKFLAEITFREVSALKKYWEVADVNLDLNWNRLEEEKNFLTLKNIVSSVDNYRNFDSQLLGVFEEFFK